MIRSPRACTLLASLLALLPVLVQAQTMTPTPITSFTPFTPDMIESIRDDAMRLAQAEVRRQVVIREGGETFPFVLDELAPERVIKGAPYCAEAIHENVQWLPDANGAASNRIVQQNITRLCRDGEGRTRQEVERGGRKRVYLRDPVARENWVLDPERKTATRMPDLRLPDLRVHLGELGLERPRAAVPPMQPSPPVPPEPVVITRTEGNGPQHRTEVKVIRLNRDGETGAMPEPPLPPAGVQFRSLSLQPRGAGSTSSLGSKEIEGVRGDGQRTSWVIEAGKIGNDKPIQITRDVWTSPDLMVTLQSRDFDPRSGEVAYRLAKLKRGEPDAAAMRVPADYSKSAVRTPPVPRVQPQGSNVPG